MYHMKEDSAIEVFKLIMNGNVKQGFETASKELGMEYEDFEQLLKIYSENPNMKSEELQSIYSMLKKNQ